MGCASGNKGGPRNIFGNKYGQNLAAVQIAREQRSAAQQLAQEQAEAQARLRDMAAAAAENDFSSDDEDDFGPSPGLWAKSAGLERASEKIADPDGDAETDTDDDDEEEEDRPTKKPKMNEE